MSSYGPLLNVLMIGVVIVSVDGNWKIIVGVEKGRKRECLEDAGRILIIFRTALLAV